MRYSLLKTISKLAKDKILILYYHRVIDREDDYLPGISTEKFEAQMRHLSKNFSFLGFNDIVEHIKEGKELSPNPVAITFDDGYMDVYTNAYPILKKYGIPASVFLTVNYIEKQELPWWDEIRYILIHTREREFWWHLSERRYILSNHLERNELAEKIIAELKKIDEDKKNKIIKEVSNQLNVKIHEQEIERLMLSWKEIKEMTDNGILFGSHTLTHPILTQISKEQLKREIIDSKRILEEKIGVPIDHFTYPNGEETNFNSEIKEMIKKAGYTCACTLISGFNTLQADLYELRRGHPWRLFTYLFERL